MAKIALLSNVNTDPIARLIEQEAEVFKPQGYGGELGMLLNPSSPLYAFQPSIVFLIEDLEEILAGGDAHAEVAVVGGGANPSAERKRLLQLKAAVNDWFTQFERALRADIVYYLSDAFMHTPLAAVSADPFIVSRTETIWNKRLVQCMASHKNVRVFPYRRVLERIGSEGALSRTMWYLGKIPHSMKAQQALAAEILHRVQVETRIPKKVLVLDLDNTLWGGLAGERDHTEILLSDDHKGLAYKNLQRVILQLKDQGVLLCIVSKNNEADALDVIRNHPHMVLGEKDFAAMKINWTAKHENIKALAAELSLGLDSFVFFDDSAQERTLVKEMLPDVTVPAFPEKPDALPDVMTKIYRAYFEKSVITEEDKNKTEQYAAEHARSDLQAQSSDFDGYLKNLDIRLIPQKPEKHVDRITQLFGKTNQFNLTTRRLTRAQIELLLEDEFSHIFCYTVKDRFGDMGLVAIAVLQMPGGITYPDSWKAAAIDRAAIGDVVKKSELPVITDLIMSCRVMGRRVEYAVVEDVERFVRDRGFDTLRAVYLPTAKNKPVATLYQDLGYTLETPFSGGGIFKFALDGNTTRNYVLKMEKQPF